MQATRISMSSPRLAVPSLRAAVLRSPLRAQALFNFGNKAPAADTSDFYKFSVKDIDNKTVKMSKYQGKVALVVNLASQCGFTPQYAELSELYQSYEREGFTVLGFPCNQFGAQEPGSNASIKQFALKEYGVKFPLFSKVDVNGNEAEPLFDWLKTQKGGFLTTDVKWNFTKFLVDREGNVVQRYGSTTTPTSIAADVEKYLAAA